MIRSKTETALITLNVKVVYIFSWNLKPKSWLTFPSVYIALFTNITITALTQCVLQNNTTWIATLYLSSDNDYCLAGVRNPVTSYTTKWNASYAPIFTQKLELFSLRSNRRRLGFHFMSRSTFWELCFSKGTLNIILEVKNMRLCGFLNSEKTVKKIWLYK